MAEVTDTFGVRLDRRRFSLLGMAVLSAGLLSACGDDEEDEGGADDPTTAPTRPAAVPTATTAATEDEGDEATPGLDPLPSPPALS